MKWWTVNSGRRTAYFILLCTVHCTLFTACGFEPVYGSLSGKADRVAPQLAQVEIANIPDREGQYLRNALIDRLWPHGRPDDAAYTLTLSKIQESLTDLDITKTADATRGQLRLDTVLTLTDNKTLEPVLVRSLRAITSYNILGSEFATRVTRENARQNALNDLARQTELQLGLYLKQGYLKQERGNR